MMGDKHPLYTMLRVLSEPQALEIVLFKMYITLQVL